ncbi:phage major capsid protein [Magnetococcales bacterium HHB-1]
MPFSAAEIANIGKSSLDHYIKNNPIDQITTDRPWLNFLLKNKKPFPGGKQYCVEQLRRSYQSDFQWFYGGNTVTYTADKTILEQAMYEWRSAHDGFSISEDRLIHNGISISDGGKTTPIEKSEMIQLTNILEEEIAVLHLGFHEKFDLELHKDGSTADSVVGLDGLISLVPNTGTTGGLDRSANIWWRNHAATGLSATPTTGDIETAMRDAWRACCRNGGRPDFIMAGSDFIDGYISYMRGTYGSDFYRPGSPHSIDGAVSQVFYEGVPIVWNPSFDSVDGAAIPAWSKRCYFINSKHLTLRPIAGQDMVVRQPPRSAGEYLYYWGITWRGVLSSNRLNAHAVLALS